MTEGKMDGQKKRCYQSYLYAVFFSKNIHCPRPVPIKLSPLWLTSFSCEHARRVIRYCPDSRASAHVCGVAQRHTARYWIGGREGNRLEMKKPNQCLITSEHVLVLLQHASPWLLDGGWWTTKEDGCCCTWKFVARSIYSCLRRSTCSAR